jgi:hypothetical protein
MIVEYGIMTNKWSVEAVDKLVCYAAILVHMGSEHYNLVLLYNDECKNDQWAFSNNTQKRLEEIFGCDVLEYMDNHEDEIRATIKTIKKLV